MSRTLALVAGILVELAGPGVAQQPGSVNHGADTALPTAIALPVPKGPFAVGTTRFVWTDSSRRDPTAPKPPVARQVIVQVWYPAEKDANTVAAPYLLEYKALRSELAQYRSLRDLYAVYGADVLGRVITHATLDAPLAPRGSAYPVIVFSHGTGMPRAFYTTLVSDLASRGYVVAAVDHPGLGLTVLPDGRVATQYEPLTQPPQGLRDKPEQERDRFWSPRNELISSDQLFVMAQLARLNGLDGVATFRGRMDLARVGLIGHSSGFQSRPCAVANQVKACVSLEGVPVLADRSAGLRRPLLNVRDGNDAAAQTTIYANMQAPAYDVLLTGSNHNSSTDLGLLSTGAARAAAERHMEIIATYVADFFDEHLNGRPSVILAGKATRFPEVSLTRHGPTAR